MQGKQQYQQQLFHYVDIESLIPDKHLLRKIQSCVDFTFVQNLTESFYCENNGRPSIPPELFFRMLLISYLYNIHSERKLCEEIHLNLAYRWFCQLTLDDKVPNHSSLTRIRDRLGEETFAKFFNEILGQCIDAGLVKGEQVLTDSTLFQANASLDSMVSNNGSIENRTTNIPGIEAPLSRKLSNKTHASKTDPDASLAMKPGSPRTLKYKSHITIDGDNRVVLDVKITTGSVHDSKPYLEQVNRIKTKYNMNIKEAIADRAYGSGQIIQSLINQGIYSNIPLFSNRSGRNKQSELSGFVFNGIDYVCPENKLLKPYPTVVNSIQYYHSKASDCKSCPQQQECLATKHGSVRIIYRHIHQRLFEQVKESMTTSVFQQKLRERLWKVEGIMNEAKHRCGLSRAKIQRAQ